MDDGVPCNRLGMIRVLATLHGENWYSFACDLEDFQLL